MAEAKKEAPKKKAAAKKSAAKKPAAKKRLARLPKLKEIRHWVGLRVDGLGNRSLGRVAGVHVDVEDGQPRWVVLRLGPVAGCTALPFEHVAEGAGRLWAAYERDWVREAPRFRPNESLSADDELELCAHWGIRKHQSRAAQLEEAAGDKITAVPGESA